MPWNIFERGREQVLQPLLDSLVADPALQAAIEADVARVNADPQDPGVPSWEWMGEDHIDWPSRVAMLAGRYAMRYALIPGHDEPAIVSIVDLKDGFEED